MLAASALPGSLPAQDIFEYRFNVILLIKPFHLKEGS